jgi:broad specificity phosphatase PhoE
VRSLKGGFLSIIDKRVILARHGEAFFNRNGFVMGRSDSPLTEQGIRTSKELALILMPEEITAIYSSPLGRAVRSAGLYAEALGLTVNVRDGMAELSCGQWEGSPRSSITSHAWKLRETWRQRPPGGESYQDAEERVAAVIREIRAESDPLTSLVVGHAGVNRVFLKLWLELSEEVAIEIIFPNDVVYVFQGGGSVLVKSAAGEEFDGLLLDAQGSSGHHQRGSS